MKKIDTSSKYILGLVGIVAVVGVIIMMINAGVVTFSTENVIGQAFMKPTAPPCTDTDGGRIPTVQGTASGGVPVSRSSFTDTCVDETTVQEYFCGEKDYRTSQRINCETALGSGSVCLDGACTDGALKVCDALYLGESIAQCEGELGSTDTPLLADGVYADTVGATRNSVAYEQRIEFYDEDTGIFLFAQDDDDAPEADMYLFADNGNNYFYRYVLNFDGMIYFDYSSAVSARIDVAGTEITMVGETYTITGITTSAGVVTSLTLEKSDGTVLVLTDGDEITQDGVDIDGSYVEIDSTAGNIDGFTISYAPETDEEYVLEGEMFTDPIFGFEFSITIEENDYETIEFAAGSTSAEILFTNSDGTAVSIPLAADSSYTSGEGSAEAIFWGAEAPSSTTSNIDELLYLEGERCQGSSSVVECQGAMFLVIDGENAHVLQITNVDTTNNELSFDDLTYSTSDNDMPYRDGYASTFSLTSADSIALVIDEGSRDITFTTIGSIHRAVITTENGATLILSNTNTAIQTFEGLLFSERDDSEVSVYLDGLEIMAYYDDITDNTIEIDSSPFTSLSYRDGFGPYDYSDVNDNEQAFMTWKGTKISYDIEDSLYIQFEHPENTVYAIVEMD